MNFSAYGLIVGIAFVLAFSLSERILHIHRPEKRRLDSLLAIVFLCGLIGARLYHVVTDWHLYANNITEVFFIWRGGLGIFGAIAGGLLGLFIWRRTTASKWTLFELIDAAAISLPFAQAIGRWGNFLNQELYGLPTNLPWAITIDLQHRFPGYESVERYHPLFFYEFLSNLAIGLGLYFLWRMGRRTRQVGFLQLGSGIFAGLYSLWYGTIRFTLEFLRIETAAGLLGISIAQWVSLGLVFLGLVLLARAAGGGGKKLFLIFLTLGTFFTITPAARAATAPFEFSLSPSVVEVAAQPGKLVTQAFLLENSGSQDWEVTPVLRDFSSDGTSGQAVLQETSSFPYATLQNADIELNKPFILKANSSQQIVLGLNIADSATRRDWYFTLLFLTNPVNIPAGGSVAKGAVGANVIVRITSDNLEPLSWDINLRLPKIIDSLQTLIIRPIVTNTSETVAAPDLNVVILDWRNQIVYEQEGLPDRVLAKSSREIFAGEQRKDDPRSFEPVPFEFDPLLAFGPYRIRTTVRNAETGPIVEEEEVIALPLSLAFAGLVFGGGVAFQRKIRRRLARSLRHPPQD